MFHVVLFSKKGQTGHLKTLTYLRETDLPGALIICHCLKEEKNKMTGFKLFLGITTFNRSGVFLIWTEEFFYGFHLSLIRLLRRFICSTVND